MPPLSNARYCGWPIYIRVCGRLALNKLRKFGLPLALLGAIWTVVFAGPRVVPIGVNISHTLTAAFFRRGA